VAVRLDLARGKRVGGAGSDDLRATSDESA
jgi:hypothetical protein